MKRGATKEEIIRITQALIARNGIRAVRVDEIAQTLGISKRTLYEMFADKDDLINACLDAMSSKQRERIATYRKQRSGSALQRTFKLAYEYIANLYMVESSFLSDLRHKIIYADHFDEHREFWLRAGAPPRSQQGRGVAASRNRGRKFCRPHTGDDSGTTAQQRHARGGLPFLQNDSARCGDPAGHRTHRQKTINRIS